MPTKYLWWFRYKCCDKIHGHETFVIYMYNQWQKCAGRDRTTIQNERKKNPNKLVCSYFNLSASFLSYISANTHRRITYNEILIKTCVFYVFFIEMAIWVCEFDFFFVHILLLYPLDRVNINMFSFVCSSSPSKRNRVFFCFVPAPFVECK